jgi:hypothetical protein
LGLPPVHRRGSSAQDALVGVKHNSILWAVAQVRIVGLLFADRADEGGSGHRNAIEQTSLSAPFRHAKQTK